MYERLSLEQVQEALEGLPPRLPRELELDVLAPPAAVKCGQENAVNANLFLRLMPPRTSDPGGGRQPPSFGREDYITEVVGAVLQADAEADGTLVHHVLNLLFGIVIEGPAWVSTQERFAACGAAESIVDLVVRSSRDLVFIENKTGSTVGVRSDGPDGEPTSQLEKYQNELDEHTAGELEGHLAMLVWAPPNLPDDRRYLDRPGQEWAFWWELYEAIQTAPPSGDPYVARLRQELLDFFDAVALDPPQALDAQSSADLAAAHRMLGMALVRASTNDVEVHHCRPAPTSPAYLFELAGADGTPQTWTVGFARGKVYARVANEGYREVNVPADFFVAEEVEQQVDWLAKALRDLPAAPPDPWWTCSRSRDDFLDEFGALRDVVEGLFALAKRRVRNDN